MPTGEISLDDHTDQGTLAPAASIRGALSAAIDEIDLAPTLRDAVVYAATGPGKLVRPLLTWHSCVAVGGDPARSIRAGVAVEMIHAFSLVHDDLPALDNDDLRRGRPTLHVHAGEAMAILAGDALMAIAIRTLMGSSASLPPLDRPAEHVAELIHGTIGMINGQIYDTLGGVEGLDGIRQLETIHRNKTGALIRAACRMGAIAADADDRAMIAVSRFSDAVGLGYQIIDDLLDVEQSTEHLGKTAGKDAEAGKLTYPAVLGIEGARRRAADLHHEANAALESLGSNAEGLRALGEQLFRRTR